MPTVLITGANRGLGLEFVQQYSADKWTVIACCRNPGKALELNTLAKTRSGIQIEALDMESQTSMHALGSRLHNTAIDALINNAGIFSGGKKPVNATDGDEGQVFGSIDPEAWGKVLRINTIAPIMFVEVILANLQRSPHAKIINITSKMGSIEEMGSGSIAYRTSKAALNAAMKTISHDLKSKNIMIANLHPGWVKTDMGSQSATLEPRESVSAMRKTIATLTPAQTGQFFNFDGKLIAW